MSLGKRLKIERIRKGVTTREVSKKFNLGKSTISNYENDYRKPDADMIRKLAEYYGVTADYLLGLTEHRVVNVSVSATLNSCKYCNTSRSSMGTTHRVEPRNSSIIDLFDFLFLLKIWLQHLHKIILVLIHGLKF